MPSRASRIRTRANTYNTAQKSTGAQPTKRPPTDYKRTTRMVLDGFKRKLA